MDAARTIPHAQFLGRLRPAIAMIRARPSLAPTRRNGTIGNKSRPASVNGQMIKSASVTEPTSPANRRRGMRRVLIQPRMITPVAATAQRLASPAMVEERPKTVATSTRGPVVWSGSRWR